MLGEALPVLLVREPKVPPGNITICNTEKIKGGNNSKRSSNDDDESSKKEDQVMVGWEEEDEISVLTGATKKKMKKQRVLRDLGNRVTENEGSFRPYVFCILLAL